MNTLALFGGTPVREKSFPSWPKPTQKLTDALLNTLHNDLWGVGSNINKEFKSKSKFCQ